MKGMGIQPCFPQTLLQDQKCSLLRLTGVVLQLALTARAGDVARPAGYKNMECLCWRDVELTVASGIEGAPSVQHLRGRFTLRFCKGKRYVQSRVAPLVRSTPLTSSF